MDCSCRMFREEPLARPCVSLTEPSNNQPIPLYEGSRDPAQCPRAGFSFSDDARLRFRRRASTSPRNLGAGLRNN
jgi:hypothetical protein